MARNRKRRPNYETMNYPARRTKLEKDSKSRRQQLDRLFARDGGICQVCHQPCERRDASRGHIKDIVLCTPEEAVDDNNMQLEHTWCNNRKHWKPSSVMRTIRDSQGRPHLACAIGELAPQLQKWLDLPSESA